LYNFLKFDIEYKTDVLISDGYRAVNEQ